jgi:hypothetical protein
MREVSGTKNETSYRRYGSSPDKSMCPMKMTILMLTTMIGRPQLLGEIEKADSDAEKAR